MDRPGLAEFLRARREALQPSDVGVPAGARRRTAGLRREEIAAVVGMAITAPITPKSMPPMMADRTTSAPGTLTVRFNTVG